MGIQLMEFLITLKILTLVSSEETQLELPPNFPIQMWNMFHRTHQELPRTNNQIEGWHRKFESICMCYHPTFWKFIILLKKEQILNRVDMVEAGAGHSPPAQRRRYVDCNQQVIAIVDDYPNRDNMRYLRGIAHNLGF